MNNVFQFFLLTFALTFSAFGQSDTSNSNRIINLKSLDIIPKPKEVKVLKGWNLISQGADIQFSNEAPSPHRLISFLKESNIKVQSFYAKKIIIEQVDDFQNDAYELNVTNDTIFIKYGDINGLKHASTTFSQLVLLNKSAHPSTIRIPAVEIKDEPTFQHRGLLLDCSRHFFEKEVVKKYIDLLEFYKMNVLHWHLTEDQAWRIAIDQYPKLETVASKRTELDGTTYEGVYTKSDIREIVEYALLRGIEVVPEIELPGHSQAAIAAYPHLSCTGKQVEVANDWGVFKEIYCAGNDSVFTFLKDVLTEVVDLFPSKYIHIGGDEAPKSRWEACAKCQNRIKSEGLKDEHELQSYFIKRIQTFLKSKGKEIIGWDEILEGGLAKGAVVQSWRGFEGGISAAKQGNKVVMSPTSHAYLDYDLKSIDLEKIYSFNPIPAELPVEFHNNIIGGECNMWTEHVPDEKTLDSKVFPRMLGMAEALWTGGDKNYEDFRERVQSHYPILDSFNVKYGEEGTAFSYNTFLRNDSLYLTFTASSPLITIYYRISERGLSTGTSSYTAPIHLEGTKLIQVQAYKNDRPYGSVKEITLSGHKALYKKVEYENEYSPWYTAGGDSGLVDGKTGSLDFKDGNWQGFWGTDATVIVDLGKVQEINEISCGFYQYINSWIFYPSDVKVEYSSNKRRWKRYNKHPISYTEKHKSRGKSSTNFVLGTTKKRQGRYVKLTVYNIGKVPDWHEAAGSDAWIFMDEIMVR